MAIVSPGMQMIHMIRACLPKMPNSLSSAGALIASLIFALPMSLLLDRPWTLAAPSTPVWAAIAGLAVLSTALAYILYFRILERAGATNLLLVTFLIPVSAILLGALVLDERLEL